MAHIFENFYTVTGENIKKYRLLRNYSLQDLADRVGLTKKTIHRYERAENKLELDRLQQLAEALEVTLEQLTEGTPLMFDRKLTVGCEGCGLEKGIRTFGLGAVSFSLCDDCRKTLIMSMI